MSRCTHETLGGSAVAAQCPQCLLQVGLMADPQITAIREGAGPTNEQAALTPGVTIAERFRVTAFIGRGGMGEIYRADDLKLGQSVALKFISRERPSSDAVRFFYDEVRLARQVSHPSVCRVYDLLEVGGRPFIVMEFVDGEDLASLLGRIGRLPYGKALEIARDVCWGLDAAHEQGIVHGDLKPANIMIDGRGRARITDFGLARLADDESRRTGERFAGTVAYMAPEQFTAREVSRATDVYSLGLVLYEIFTGRRAHEISRLEDVQGMFEALPTRPSIDQPRIALDIERTIFRCLSVDPRDRPDSVRAVLASLGGADAVDAMILAGETPTPEYVAAIRKLQPLRRWQSVSILSASLLCLAVILVLSSHLTLYARTNLGKSPVALAEHARDLAIRFGSAAPIADDGYWFEANLDHLRHHTSELARGEMIGGDLIPPIVFHYRSSRSAMAPLGAGGQLRSDDPPPTDPGMVHIALAPDGRVVMLQSLAPESTSNPRTSVRWADILAEAEVDSSRAVPSATNWSPPVPHDTKFEWRSDGALIRAARNGDHLSDFELVDPTEAAPVGAIREWTLPDAVYYAVISAALVAGVFLSRRNFRLRRVDRRGAIRLAMWVLFCRLMFGLVASHHPLVIEKEAAHLATLAGAALLLTAEVSLAYVALEPLVRQRWPNLMIGWMRFGQGRFRDAIVGREILVGTLAGLLFRLFDHVRNVMPRLIPSLRVIPSHLAIDTLGSMREVIGALFYYQARAIFYALFALFLLLLLSMVLRTEALSAIAWLSATTAIWSRWDDLRIDIPIVVIQMTILLLTLKRFGLLSLITALYTDLLTAQFPLTVDPTRFYFLSSTLVSMLIAALILLGFYASFTERRSTVSLRSAAVPPAL